MRVESNRPMRNGGWFHPVNAVKRFIPFRKPIVPILQPTLDVQKFWDGWAASTVTPKIQQLANDLGVTLQSLAILQCVWAEDKTAFAFPMKDADQNMIGVRFRNWAAEKWSLKGSRNGLFIPDVTVQDTVYICEGPTDTAAALSMMMYAIGRPSCSGGVELVKDFVERNRIKKAIIIADNDDPGLRGASVLSESLDCQSCIIVPPAKDIRAFLKSGGTKVVIDSIVGCTLWKK